MRLYLSLGSIPELSDLSPPERRRAWRYAARRIWFRPVPLVGLLLVAAAPVTFAEFVVPATAPSILLRALLVLVVGSVVGLLYASLLTHCARPYLREFRETE